ncbi:MAG: hypothetical protein WC521_05635 [Bdellovibrionales bacterium]
MTGVYLAYSEMDKIEHGGVIVVYDASSGSTCDTTNMFIPSPGNVFSLPSDTGYDLKPVVLEKLFFIGNATDSRPDSDIGDQIYLNLLSPFRLSADEIMGIFSAKARRYPKVYLAYSESFAKKNLDKVRILCNAGDGTVYRVTHEIMEEKLFGSVLSLDKKTKLPSDMLFAIEPIDVKKLIKLGNGNILDLDAKIQKQIDKKRLSNDDRDRVWEGKAKFLRNELSDVFNAADLTFGL